MAEGRTIEETAIFETKEETGFDIELVKKLFIFHEHVKGAVKHLFLGQIIKGELNFPKDEIMDARWFTKEELLKMDNLRGAWILEGIKIYEN